MRPIEKLSSNGLYRSRHGVLLGVCRGLAQFFDFSVFWARLLMKPEPVIPIRNEDEQEFYDSYTGNRHRALKRLKHRFERLERRIQQMEHIVTAPEYAWDRRMND